MIVDCPACHHANREGARFCQHCGQELGVASPPVETSLASVPCPGCGVENRPGRRFCKACGTTLQGTNEQVAEVAAVAESQVEPLPEQVVGAEIEPQAEQEMVAEIEQPKPEPEVVADVEQQPEPEHAAVTEHQPEQEVVAEVDSLPEPEHAAITEPPSVHEEAVVAEPRPEPVVEAIADARPAGAKPSRRTLLYAGLGACVVLAVIAAAVVLSGVFSSESVIRKTQDASAASANQDVIQMAPGGAIVDQRTVPAAPAPTVVAAKPKASAPVSQPAQPDPAPATEPVKPEPAAAHTQPTMAEPDLQQKPAPKVKPDKKAHAANQLEEIRRKKQELKQQMGLE